MEKWSHTPMFYTTGSSNRFEVGGAFYSLTFTYAFKISLQMAGFHFWSQILRGTFCNYVAMAMKSSRCNKLVLLAKCVLTLLPTGGGGFLAKKPMPSDCQP